MQGCRPLTDDELILVSRTFGGQYENRDRALLWLGVSTGFRISELLSLRVSDVITHNTLNSQITVQRRFMKRKRRSRTVSFKPTAQHIVRLWLDDMARLGWLQPSSYLFRGRIGGNKPISRQHAHHILREVYESNELTGKLATHTLRKTYAGGVWEECKRLGKDPLLTVSRALGHSSVQTTLAYLSFREEDIDDAVDSFMSRFTDTLPIEGAA